MLLAYKFTAYGTAVNMILAECPTAGGALMNMIGTYRFAAFIAIFSMIFTDAGAAIITNLIAVQAEYTPATYTFVCVGGTYI